MGGKWVRTKRVDLVHGEWVITPRVTMDADDADEALRLLEEAMYAGSGHQHWDREMTGGANCPLCIQRREFNDKARAFLARVKP